MKEEQKYINMLVDLGMKDHEAKVYLACLMLGQATVGKISEVADVQRTFVYDILSDLHEKGYVSSVEIRGKKHFSAISIEQFKRIQQDKFHKFEHLIPEIKVFETTVGDRPRVRFFEGAEGIKTALFDTLDAPKGSEILAYATGTGFYEDEPEFALDYIKERVKRGIYSRSVAVDSPQTRQYTDKNNEHLRETRLVPADKFDFTNEIDICQNKVVILSLKGELLAVIIESESVAKTQRMIFELAWLGAERCQTISND